VVFPEIHKKPLHLIQRAPEGEMPAFGARREKGGGGGNSGGGKIDSHLNRQEIFVYKKRGEKKYFLHGEKGRKAAFFFPAAWSKKPAIRGWREKKEGGGTRTGEKNQKAKLKGTLPKDQLVFWRGENQVRRTCAEI